MYVFALRCHPSPARREDASDGVFMHLSIFRIRVTLRSRAGTTPDSRPLPTHSTEIFRGAWEKIALEKSH